MAPVYALGAYREAEPPPGPKPRGVSVLAPSLKDAVWTADGTTMTDQSEQGFRLDGLDWALVGFSLRGVLAASKLARHDSLAMTARYYLHPLTDEDEFVRDLLTLQSGHLFAKWIGDKDAQLEWLRMRMAEVERAREKPDTDATDA